MFSAIILQIGENYKGSDVILSCQATGTRNMERHVLIPLQWGMIDYSADVHPVAFMAVLGYEGRLPV